MVLNHAARDGVAVSSALALLINVGLDGQALARPVVVLQVAANLDDGQRDFVAQAGGIVGQVAVV